MGKRAEVWVNAIIHARPGGNDRSVMSLHLPVPQPFGINAEVVDVAWGGDASTAGANGPSIGPCEHSALRYAWTTSGCS